MIYKKLKYLLVLVVSIIFLLPLTLSAKDNGKVKRPVLAKTKGSQVVTTRMDINNLNALQANNGYSDYNLNSNLEGTEYPKGSGKNVVFQSGFLWGGFVSGDPQVRVGGSTYTTGLQAGPVIGGVAANPDDPKYSIFRVRPDVYPGGPSVDLSSDAALEGTTEAALLAQYQADWKNWPAAGTSNDLGAPFKDVNGDGKYEPDIDIPGVPGADQTIYYVANDYNSSMTKALYGAMPLGLELHATFWAYAQSGALGNMYFKKWDLINKGTNNIDSMFVSFWADVDLGTSTDDVVGSDTTLSMSYCYNGQSTDATFAPLPPPAIGFDFFQGPMVSGAATDSAIFNGKVYYGKRNLPMTSSYFFVNGSAIYNDPDLNQISGSSQFYNLFNGNYRDGAPMVDNNNVPTKFAFPGDPVTGTGWIDGVDIAPADRRQGMASGPFNLAPNDTQEVVVAEIVAGAVPGVDYLQAVTLMKKYDVIAQNAYDHFFNLPSPQVAPKVVAVGLDKKVVLDWGEDLAGVAATENTEIPDQIHGGTYKFQGYKVYQFPYKGASVDAAKIIATYDLADGVTKIPYVDPTTLAVSPDIFIQTGYDLGVQRTITVSSDVFNSNKALSNGTKYYFAVTSYNYNPQGVPQSLENPISVITVTPQSPTPGLRYTYNVGDTIISTHTAGRSDGSVVVLVANPTRLTGDKYSVTFDTTGGTTTWKLTDVTKNTVVLNGQTNQAGDEKYSITDGLQVKVIGPPPGMKTYNIPSGKRDWTFANADAFGLEGFSGAMGMGYSSAPSGWFSSSTITPVQLHKVLIKFATIDASYKITDPSDANVSSAYRYLRHASSAAADPAFAPFIVNPSAGYAYQDRRIVPFAAYDEDNNNQRLDVGFLENNAEGGRVDGLYDPPSNNDNINNASVTREFFFIFGTNYGTTDKAELATDILDNTTPLMWWGLPNMRATNLFAAGDEFEIVPNYVNSVNDQFTFTAVAPTSSVADAKKDINSINVFPNPYYGVNSQETTKYARFVTFNHLPATATIRIFNLAGIQVRKIEHTNGTQFEQWDLTNESQLPVASGLYIVYIDMPSIGATKILKAAIIQEQQFPDKF